MQRLETTEMKREMIGFMLHVLCCIPMVQAQGVPSSVQVLIPTANWGQSSPYNSQLPLIDGRLPQAGCVPVACAIIMNHYRWPYCGVGGAVPGRAYSQSGGTAVRDLSQPYAWSSMQSSYSSGQDAGCVARLLADIGAVCNTFYGVESSYTFLPENGIIRRFGYNPDMQRVYRSDHSDSLWHDMIRQELEGNRPVLYSAARTGGSHTFVIDGYDSSGRYHVNWGWGGNHNGWYRLDNLKAGSYDYNQSHSMVRGFVPNYGLYQGVSPDNLVKYMGDMSLVYNKKKGSIVINHPLYAVVSVKSCDTELYDILTRWSESTTINIGEYPDGDYDLTVFAGPYSRQIHFTIKRH